MTDPSDFSMLTDDDLSAIRSQVADWGIAFSKSQRFGTLSPTEQDHSRFIIEMFTDLIAAYEARDPDAWDAPSVKRTCTEHFPRKISGERQLFESVSPVLATFFEFLADRDHLSNGVQLADTVRTIDEQISSNAQNPANWGPAKSALIDAADDAGVSIGDVDSIEAVETLLDAQPLDMPDSERSADDPGVLDPAAADRFDGLLMRLLSYVNDRFDILPAVSGYGDLEARHPEDLMPVRRRLFEAEPAAIIADYVEENPHGLDSSDLDQVEAWKQCVTGEFVIMEYRDRFDVFLDPEHPRAYAVRSPFERLSAVWPASELPVPVTDVVLLPFDGQIVGDGWIDRDPAKRLVWEIMDEDIERRFAEARRHEGIIASLPATEAAETDPAETLRYYLKNQENRDRYAEDIAELKTQSEELERIYHEELGKAQARSLGHTFRDLGLEAAFVAIYDGQVVASAPTKPALQETLEAIMPAGREEFPYVYQYDP